MRNTVQSLFLFVFFLEIYQEIRDFFSVVIHALSLIVGW